MARLVRTRSFCVSVRTGWAMLSVILVLSFGGIILAYVYGNDHHMHAAVIDHQFRNTEVTDHEQAFMINQSQDQHHHFNESTSIPVEQNISYKFPDWYFMNNSELSHFFTANELNQLTSYPKCKPTNDFPMFCCIGCSSQGSGGVWKKQSTCLRDPHKFHNYKRILRLPNHRMPHTMNELFWNLKNNTKIFVLGDSVQHQLVEGLICDILRNNRYNKKVQLIVNDDINMSLLSPQWNDTEAVNDLWFKYKLLKSMRFNWTLVGHDTTTTPNGNAHVIQLMFLRLYRPWIPYMIDWFCKWADIYLMSWDLHYSNDLFDSDWTRDIGDGMLQIVQKCFNQFDALENKPLFIWRETAAQHFGTVGGYWKEDIYPLQSRYNVTYRQNLTEKSKKQFRMNVVRKTGNDLLLTNDTLWSWYHQGHFRGETRPLANCVPLTFSIDEYLERYFYRERIAKYMDEHWNATFQWEYVWPDREVTNDRTDTMYLIPFKDLTDEMWNMHNDRECTHYCTGPYIWQFVWDEMYRIVMKHSYHVQ